MHYDSKPEANYDYSSVHPKKRKRWPWVLGALLAVVACAFGGVAVLGVGGAAVVNQVETEEANRTADVKITSCAKTIIDTVEVKYTIVNSGTTPRTYILDVEVKDDKGTRIGTANGLENEVKPGVTAKGTAVGTIEGGSGKFTCSLVSA
jgi:hypothetical protein